MTAGWRAGKNSCESPRLTELERLQTRLLRGLPRFMGFGYGRQKTIDFFAGTGGLCSGRSRLGAVLREVASLRPVLCRQARLASRFGWAFVGALALTGSAQTQADIIADINWEVNHTRPYKYSTRKIPEARYLKPGEAGNYTDKAFTRKVELEKRGIWSMFMACRLQDGQGHAFLMAPGGCWITAGIG